MEIALKCSRSSFVAKQGVAIKSIGLPGGWQCHRCHIVFAVVVAQTTGAVSDLVIACDHVVLANFIALAKVLVGSFA